jgi:hypothetical protein
MLKMKAASIAAAVLTMSLIAASKPTKPGDCGTLMTELFNHHGSIDVTLVSMNVNGVASYSKMFQLQRTGHREIRPAGTVRTLRGRGKQQFNDRVAGEQPFNLAQSDDLQVDFASHSGTPRVTFTLLSWNRGQIWFTPSCDGGLMHGWSDNGRTYYTLHFTRTGPIG